MSLGSKTPSPTTRGSILSKQMRLTGDGRAGSQADILRGGDTSGLRKSKTAEEGSLFKSRDAASEAAPALSGELRRGTNASEMTLLPVSARSSTASRFMSAISSRWSQAPPSPAQDEELCNLNIEAVLLSGVPPSERDLLSPVASKILQANAVEILTKMQEAYRRKAIALRDLEAEKSAQLDEFEEAETRAQHLRMQLEGMATKAQEQEDALQQLMDELAAERKARAEESMARKVITNTEGSVVSEDLGVDDDHVRQKWRKSRDTVKSDVSFETDEESMESASIFSCSRSPTFATGVTGADPGDRTASQTKSNTSVPPTSRETPQLSAFQRIVKGIAGDADAGAVTKSCRNCKGQDASVAWDTISRLRDENKHLKLRVAELESTVDGVLDMVNGVGL